MENTIMGGASPLQAARNAEIPMQLQRLGHANDVLAEVIDKLQGRLVSVLRMIPENPNKEATVKQQEPITQVGQIIDKLVDNIEISTSRITDMINRVEL